jgi:hypothetical protein
MLTVMCGDAAVAPTMPTSTSASYQSPGTLFDAAGDSEKTPQFPEDAGHRAAWVGVILPTQESVFPIVLVLCGHDLPLSVLSRVYSSVSKRTRMLERPSNANLGNARTANHTKPRATRNFSDK